MAKMNYKSSGELKKLRDEYVGKVIHIISMVDEPQYKDKSGVCKFVDDIGQLHGTWGGCTIVPEIDEFEVAEQDKT